MTQNKELYEIAKKYIGTTGREARAYCGLPQGASWCDAYVSFIFYKGGLKDLYCKGTKQTYCPTSIRICESLLAQIPVYLALPMDVIFFDWEHNGIPNHIGFVKQKKSASEIVTHEGNTSGGIVAEKTRTANYVQAVFRPHFKAPAKPDTYILKVDGNFGYKSIYSLQHVLGIKEDGILGKATVKALQKACGASCDGAWGANTSRKVQKMTGATSDGVFGQASVKSLQAWINAQMDRQGRVIDVSYWQHEINWKKVKTDDIIGAIIRTSYTSQGSFILNDDSTFQQNIKGAHDSGIPCGAYHYSQAISVSEAKREAEHMCRLLLPYKDKITMPAVCDWEFGGRLSAQKARALGREKCTEIVSAFCDTVIDYGFTPMVYANLVTFRNYLNFTKLKNKYLIWLAQYNDTASIDYDYWQYSSRASVKGIKGNCDVSVKR